MFQKYRLWCDIPRKMTSAPCGRGRCHHNFCLRPTSQQLMCMLLPYARQVVHHHRSYWLASPHPIRYLPRNGHSHSRTRNASTLQSFPSRRRSAPKLCAANVACGASRCVPLPLPAALPSWPLSDHRELSGCACPGQWQVLCVTCVSLATRSCRRR